VALPHSVDQTTPSVKFKQMSVSALQAATKIGRHGKWKKPLAAKILVKVANWRQSKSTSLS